ncbi:MAG: hypothetical protein KGQ66_09685 [Acidobacteriota bacterium]|nr:hypothetical protein [Acidobacteriota bacterium]
MATTPTAEELRRLSTAAALIAKAEATTFPAEQQALALRAYTELAAYLNSVEAKNPGPRRRERRLFDRRAAGDPGRNAAAGTTSGPPGPGSFVFRGRNHQVRTAYRATIIKKDATGEHVNVGL